MPEATTPELENKQSKYNIHLEPGIHSFPGTDIFLGIPKQSEVAKKFWAGDLSAHAWNPQVAERMKQYKPLVLGLDSVPGPYFTYSGKEWYWLPGSPEEMSGRKSMYLIGGDLLHWQYFEIREMKDLGNDVLTDYIKKGTTEGVSILLAAIMLSKAAQQLNEIAPRRKFLQNSAKALGVGALALLLGKLSPVVQSYSPTPITEGVSQRITEVTKPWFSKSTWLDGRTALIIAKTLEAMDILGLPKGTVASIVMGYPHLYEARRLLEDKEYRIGKIREFAQEFYNETHELTTEHVNLDYYVKEGLIKDPFDKEEVEAFIKAEIFYGFTLGTIIEVKQPQSYHTDDPFETIISSFKWLEHFESEEVKAALIPLGYKGNPTKK